MDYRKTNNIISWSIFAVTFVIYTMTVAPTVSYWDCGEFIAASFKLAVPHPPGAPLYLLVGRIFSMIPFVTDIGLRVNMISVLSSAFSVMLLYLTIVHLIREWKGKLENAQDWQMAIFSGLLGAFTFAFTHSFWFNAVEAEVYAPSMLFTALIVWLSLVWAEKSETDGNERYILMIAYVIGLALGVHLLVILALPFVTLTIFYKKFKFSWTYFTINALVTIAVILIIYPTIVKYLPQLARLSVFWFMAFFILLIWVTLWSIFNNKKLVSLISLSIVLIIIGYSSYSMIYIRSNLNPNIDENNPETLEKFIDYLERKQYGDHSITDRTKVWKESPNGKRYRTVGEFFWKYQINKMYNRYFLWQFVGMSDNEEDWSPKQFYFIPLFLGIFGIWWQFKNDYKHGLAVLALFLATGLAIILYLNQPDPQPRERDYSYVGSFFAFSIWIGLGYAGLLELIRGNNKDKEEKRSNILPVALFVILFIASPVVMLAKNYESHDRSGRYIAWDYSYNMLQSCEPNAIIFTNGDNDTFPLWYLQEVDSVRTDVRIVNLSLLNTDWYIKQLRDLDPKVPISLSENEIDQLGLVPWKKSQVSFPVPKTIGEQQANEFQSKFQNMNINIPEKISFEVKPTLNTPYGSMLRVQDYMILNIIHANKWRKPIYFAVTVAKSNMLSELQEYMRMDGLALKLVPYKNWKISPDNLEKNLTEVYKYRGLQNPNVHYDNNIKGLLQNYRTAFLQVAEYHARQKDFDKVSYLLADMEQNIPSAVIPWTNNYLRLIRDSYTLLINSDSLDSVINGKYSDQELSLIGENLYRLEMLDAAGKIFEKVYENNQDNVQALSILINIYERTEKYSEAISFLENWLKRNPRDTQAQAKLNLFRQKANI